MYCCCAGRAVVQFKFLTRPAQVIQINLAARSVTGRAAQVELAGDKIAGAGLAVEQKCNRFLASRPLLTRLNWPKECSPLPAVGSGRTPGSQQSKQAGRLAGPLRSTAHPSFVSSRARPSGQSIFAEHLAPAGLAGKRSIACRAAGSGLSSALHGKTRRFVATAADAGRDRGWPGAGAAD